MIWGIWRIFMQAPKSLDIGTLMGSFCPNYINYIILNYIIFFPMYKKFELRIYRAVKVWWQWRVTQNVKEITGSWCQKWHEWGIGEFNSVKSRRPNTENLSFDEILLSKVYNAPLQVKVFRGVMCVDTRGVMQSFGKKVTDNLKIIYVNIGISWGKSKYINLFWKIAITCDSSCNNHFVVSSLPNLLYKFREKKTVDWKTLQKK